MLVEVFRVGCLIMVVLLLVFGMVFGVGNRGDNGCLGVVSKGGLLE